MQSAEVKGRASAEEEALLIEAARSLAMYSALPVAEPYRMYTFMVATTWIGLGWTRLADDWTSYCYFHVRSSTSCCFKTGIYYDVV
mmetsp:Transcript_11636/g.24602  ORF Transcript_11636/g.24602 Transcript_11636/m.24602 type:complete len:86 (+) Transcript_11636:371-628(+)